MKRPDRRKSIFDNEKIRFVAIFLYIVFGLILSGIAIVILEFLINLV